MTLESLQEARYSELLKIAGRLQLEPPQSKKKDVLIRLISEHCAKHDVDENLIQVTKKKLKKTSKKSKKQAEEESEPEIDPANQTMTRSRTRTLNKTLNTTEPQSHEPTEAKKVKKTKKSSKKEPNDNQEPEVIDTRYETREDGKRVKIKRIRKKVNREEQNLPKEENKTKKSKKTKADTAIDCPEKEHAEHVEQSSACAEPLEESDNFKLQLNDSEKESLTDPKPAEHVEQSNACAEELDESDNFELQLNQSDEIVQENKDMQKNAENTQDNFEELNQSDEIVQENKDMEKNAENTQDNLEELNQSDEIVQENKDLEKNAEDNLEELNQSDEIVQENKDMEKNAEDNLEELNQSAEIVQENRDMAIKAEDNLEELNQSVEIFKENKDMEKNDEDSLEELNQSAEIVQENRDMEKNAEDNLEELSQSGENEKVESLKRDELNEAVDCSLITNDEEKTDNEQEFENLNVTRDIVNTTMEKGDRSDAHLNMEEKSAVVTPQSVEEKKFDQELADKKKSVEESKSEEPAKSRIGGARIVRPKQTVTVVQTIKSTKNETAVEEVRKVVEVVNREAGPRIVKPTILISEDSCADPKRKITNDANNKVKKIKDNETKKKDAEEFKAIARKAPDFKAIHEKESQKLESIDAYANRKQERLDKLAEKSSPSVTQDKLKAKARTPIFSAKPQSIFSKKTPLKSGATPKFVKNLTSQTGSLLSNISKMVKRDEHKKEESNKCDIETVEPKTPEMPVQEKWSKIARTPSSVSKPTESSLLKSNIKRTPSLKINEASNPASMTPQLQSSSFVRRKSFDLSKSLSRPLKYNPHHGRLKKVDFSTKSVFLASLATNLNESKCNEKCVFKPNDSILNGPDTHKRRVSTINKVRSDNGGMCTDRNMVSDYLKSDKLKKNNDKSTQMAKKLRLEKTKMKKMAISDQHRQLENMDNIENQQV